MVNDEMHEGPASPDDVAGDEPAAAVEPTAAEPVEEPAEELADEQAEESVDEPPDEQAEESVDERPEPPPDTVFSCNDPVQRQEGMAAAKRAISTSGLVVMPTDTVYGLAADAFDPIGVRRLLRAKGRGRRMPTPVLIGSADTLRALATRLTPETRELSREFWPGALTLICREQPTLRWDLGDNRSTVAIRMPAHDDALALLADNGPLAVSSANKTGQPPATTVEEAWAMLGAAVEVYLDAGPTPGPVPSTIVDATGDTLRLVREGAISLERLREVIPSIEADEPAAGDDA